MIFTTPIITSFAGANEDPLSESGNWTWPINGTNNSLQVVSNQVKRGNQNASAQGQAYYDTQVHGPNCEVYLTMLVGEASLTVGAAYSVVCRIQNPNLASFNGYYGSWRDATGWRIFKAVNGSFSQIGATETGFNPVAGDKIGMIANGNNIVLGHYSSGVWVERVNTTDSSVPGPGYLGIEFNGTEPIADDFGGGTIALPMQEQRPSLLGLRAGW